MQENRPRFQEPDDWAPDWVCPWCGREENVPYSVFGEEEVCEDCYDEEIAPEIKEDHRKYIDERKRRRGKHV